MQIALYQFYRKEAPGGLEKIMKISQRLKRALIWAKKEYKAIYWNFSRRLRTKELLKISASKKSEITEAGKIKCQAHFSKSRDFSGLRSQTFPGWSLFDLFFRGRNECVGWKGQSTTSVHGDFFELKLNPSLNSLKAKFRPTRLSFDQSERVKISITNPKK